MAKNTEKTPEVTAKNESTLTHLGQLVPFGLVFWFKTKNERDDYGNLDEARNSLARIGWDTGLPAKVTLIQTIRDLVEAKKTEKKCTEADALAFLKKEGKRSEQEIAVSELETRWAALKDDTTSDTVHKLQVFEALHVKDGQIIAPIYSGNSGFRRSTAFEDAMVQRRKNDNGTDEDRALLPLIPVLVKRYNSESERIIDQQMENSLQGLGTKKMSDKEMLKISMKLYRLGKRDMDIRKLYNSSGQKFFNICRMDAYWPALQIFHRCLLDLTDPNHVPLSKLRADVLVKFNNRKEADDKRKKNEPLNDREKALEPLTQEMVASFLNDLRDGRQTPGQEKPMLPKMMKSIAEQNNVTLFKMAFNAAVTDKADTLTPYLDYADGLNTHTAMIDAGFGSRASDAIKFANEQPDLFQFVLDSLKTLSPVEFITALTATVETKKKAATAIKNPEPAKAS